MIILNKFIESNTRQELEAARNFMFKTSNLRNSKPSTATRNIARQTVSSSQKQYKNLDGSDQAKSRVLTPPTRPTTKGEVHKDKLREFYGLERMKPETAMTSRKPRNLELDMIPPVPIECLKTARDYKEYNEFEEEKRKKDEINQRIKNSKKDYTFKYKHLTRKVLNIDKAYHFKNSKILIFYIQIFIFLIIYHLLFLNIEEEAKRISSDEEDNNTSEERRRVVRSSKRVNIKRGFTKLQSKLNIFYNEIDIPLPGNRSEANSFETESSEGQKTTKNKPMKGFDKLKKAANKIKAQKLTKNFVENIFNEAKMTEIERFKKWKGNKRFLVIYD